MHSYPNVKFISPSLPVILSNITGLTISAEWTMYPSDTGNKGIFDVEGLNSIGAKADVTLDFFLDPDMKQSKNVTNPKYEVMIWFSSLNGTNPIGIDNGITGSTTLDGQN